MKVTVPPRLTDAPDDRDLTQRVADLEALIEEARRRARRRRLVYATVVLAAITAGVAASFGLGVNGSGSLTGSQAPESSAAHPASGRWQPSRGPDGGAVVIAVDPAHPGVLYAGGWGNVFKSTDGGGSWKDVTAKPWTRVDSLAIDPTHPSIVYAGTDRGVAKTTDGGRHWRMVNGGLVEYEPGRNHGEGIYSLVVDVHHPRTVFANSDGALVKTTDAGAHWRIIGPEPYRTESCPHCAVLIHGYQSAAAIDPDRAETIYASWSSTGPTGFYKSTNGGTSWRRVQTRGFPSAQLGSLVGDWVSGTLYATASSPGVYKSIDGGGTWSSAGLDGETPWGLTVNGGTVYAGLNGSLLETDDGGATWQPVGTGPNLPDGDVVSDPKDPSTLYGIGDGVVKSVDGGRTWSLADDGVVSTLIPSLTLQPDSSDVLYAGSYGTVFKSTDGGRSWLRGETELGTGAIVALAVDPENRQIVYAGGWYDGLFRSEDAGRTWRAVETRLKSIGAIAIDPHAPSTLYVGASSSAFSANGRLLKTVDGGATWQMITGIPWAVQSLALDPRTPSTVFAGTNHGLYRSRDGGGTWQRVTTASPAPNGVYFNLSFGFAFVAVAIDPLNSDNIYAGIRSHGILRSSDGGNTWTAADTGLTDERITAIALDPRDPRILYAAAAGGGVFRSTDGARTWHPFGTGLVHSADNVTAFAIGPSGRAVFAATEGDGVVRLGFGR